MCCLFRVSISFPKKPDGIANLTKFSVPAVPLLSESPLRAQASLECLRYHGSFFRNGVDAASAARRQYTAPQPARFFNKRMRVNRRRGSRHPQPPKRIDHGRLPHGTGTAVLLFWIRSCSSLLVFMHAYFRGSAMARFAFRMVLSTRLLSCLQNADLPPQSVAPTHCQ